MRLGITWGLAAGLFLALPAAAGELVLEGAFTQGGLVVGRTEPGAEVTVDGDPVRVSPDGVFLIGLGRDAPPSVVVRVDGGEPRTIEVARRSYPEQRIDGLAERKVTPSAEDLERIRADGALISGVRTRDSARTGFASGFVWPLRGTVSGVFGSRRILNGEPRRPHSGLDIAAPRGTPVGAAAAGVVVLVHEDMFFTGRTLMIDHGHGLTSVYAHLGEILAADGQTVAKGAPIGRVGSSGRATGPHLHWGVSLFSTRLDPALLVD